MNNIFHFCWCQCQHSFENINSRNIDNDRYAKANNAIIFILAFGVDKLIFFLFYILIFLQYEFEFTVFSVPIIIHWIKINAIFKRNI